MAAASGSFDQLRTELDHFAKHALKEALESFREDLLAQLLEHVQPLTSGDHPGLPPQSIRGRAASSTRVPTPDSVRFMRGFAQTHPGGNIVDVRPSSYTLAGTRESTIRELTLESESTATPLLDFGKVRGSVSVESQPSYKVPIELDGRFSDHLHPRPSIVKQPELGNPARGLGEASSWGCEEGCGRWCQHKEMAIYEIASALVGSPGFEQCVGVLVLINSFAIGVETDWLAKNIRGDPIPLWMELMEGIFCIIFAAELCLRVYVFRGKFFKMESWMWNVLDTLMVVLQLLDELAHLCDTMTLPVDARIMRMLRIVRLVRVTRVIRVLHLFDELRTIVTSMTTSIGSLFWALVLLLMMLYIFSVFFLSIVTNSLDRDAPSELHKWFSSLGTSFLTMFECIVGGIGWDDIVQPLIHEISPVMGALFSLYIGSALFAMMNLVTAVFVEKVTKSVREDKDVYMANRISDLFMQDNHHGQIFWDDFTQKLESNTMKDYLKTIDVDPSEARGLFELLDADGSGSVDTDEMVNGFLKLRGPAKALDFSLMMRQIGQHRAQFGEFTQLMDRRLEAIFFAISK